VPNHAPLEPVRVAPWIGLPEIMGRAVFAGAVGVVGAPATDPVGLEVTAFAPAELVAVTTTRIADPTSAVVRE
jgi:hypothetical protein